MWATTRPWPRPIGAWLAFSRQRPSGKCSTRIVGLAWPTTTPALPACPPPMAAVSRPVAQEAALPHRHSRRSSASWDDTYCYFQQHFVTKSYPQPPGPHRTLTASQDSRSRSASRSGSRRCDRLQGSTNQANVGLPCLTCEEAMDSIRLSTKGQIVIPREIRARHHWGVRYRVTDRRPGRCPGAAGVQTFPAHECGRWIGLHRLPGPGEEPGGDGRRHRRSPAARLGAG